MSAPRDTPVFFTDRDLGTRFPDTLAAAGLQARRHRDHFPHDCPDEIWLETVGREGWIALSHNARIRYTPNELAAVVRHRVRLVIVVGKAPYPQLAKHFVATAPRVAEFVEQHSAPWIAKVYRPSPAELAKNQDAPGSVSLWYPPKKP